MILNEIQATATPRELLAVDGLRPLVDLVAHPAWQSVLNGEMSREKVGRLILCFYPVIAGPGRYLFSAKVSQISAEDGAELFRAIYEAEQKPEADADAGWQVVGEAFGLAEEDFDKAIKNLTPEAADYLKTAHQHSLRSSPAVAAAVAWAVERQLPRLWGALADSLEEHYDVPKTSLHHLRYHQARTKDVDTWIEHLIERYFDTATPYEVFEARRALWEITWAWTALTESIS